MNILKSALKDNPQKLHQDVAFFLKEEGFSHYGNEFETMVYIYNGRNQQCMINVTGSHMTVFAKRECKAGSLSTTHMESQYLVDEFEEIYARVVENIENWMSDRQTSEDFARAFRSYNRGVF